MARSRSERLRHRVIPAAFTSRTAGHTRVHLDLAPDRNGLAPAWRALWSLRHPGGFQQPDGCSSRDPFPVVRARPLHGDLRVAPGYRFVPLGSRYLIVVLRAPTVLATHGSSPCQSWRPPRPLGIRRSGARSIPGVFARGTHGRDPCLFRLRIWPVRANLLHPQPQETGEPAPASAAILRREGFTGGETGNSNVRSVLPIPPHFIARVSTKRS